MSRNWNESTRRVAEELEQEFGVTCSTYPEHGRPGEAWSIDVWVAPFRSKANREQEALGDRIQRYVETNWDRFGLDYMIWWNWMKEDKHTAWFSYEQEAFRWPGGDADPDTRRHLDHLHLSCRPGFRYLAKPTRPHPPAPAPTLPAKPKPEPLKPVRPPLSKKREKAEVQKLFTVAQLAEISQNPDPVAYDLAGDAAALIPEMVKADITTPARMAAFLANVCQETDHLNTLEEYGDEAYFRSFLGDEWLYHGRGYLMNTWKAAYQRLSKILGVDLVSNPDLLAEDKDLAAKAACWYWTQNGINAYADRGDFGGVCELINRGEADGGPVNGWDMRVRFHERAKRVLGANRKQPATSKPTFGPIKGMGEAMAEVRAEIKGLNARVGDLEAKKGTRTASNGHTEFATPYPTGYPLVIESARLEPERKWSEESPAYKSFVAGLHEAEHNPTAEGAKRGVPEAAVAAVATYALAEIGLPEADLELYGPLAVGAVVQLARTFEGYLDSRRKKKRKAMRTFAQKRRPDAGSGWGTG